MYFVCVNYGEGMSLVNRDMQYVSTMKNAAVFDDETSAHAFIDRHGLDKIAFVVTKFAK